MVGFVAGGIHSATAEGFHAAGLAGRDPSGGAPPPPPGAATAGSPTCVASSVSRSTYITAAPA